MACSGYWCQLVYLSRIDEKNLVLAQQRHIVYVAIIRPHSLSIGISWQALIHRQEVRALKISFR